MPLPAAQQFRRLIRQSLGAVLAVYASAGLAQAAAQAPACPPTAEVPTQEQALAGMRDAQDHGVLWRISKDGRSSYLFGTLHVGRQAWIFPGPALQRALKNTELLALELDVTDPAVQQAMSTPLATEQLPVISATLRKRMDAQAAQACIPADALAGLHPVLQMVTYAVLAGRWDGLDPAYGQEFVLAGFAKARQRPLIGLETAESQRQALIPASAAEALETVEQTLTLLETDKVRAPLKRLALAWARGDLAELESYEQWCECIKDESDRKAMRKLNDERNPLMAERIDALHMQGKPLLAAVGTLHMTGPQDLTRLLAQRGYAVERVGASR